MIKPRAHCSVEVDQLLDRLNPTFCRLYPEGSSPSAIYGIHSERMLAEQLDCNLLFRWFVGLNPDEAFRGPLFSFWDGSPLLSDPWPGRLQSLRDLVEPGPTKRPRILIWLLCKSSWVSATLPWHLVHRLEERAAYEGRSLSDLIAHILEGAG